MNKKTRQAVAHGVVIDAEVLRNIRQHARSELDTEICGVLIGSGEEDVSLISASIPGLDAEKAGTHVTFTQDTWQHIYRVKDRDFPDERIIGWYHSHPGFGVFLSDHDTFIHRNFFSAPGQIAWVFDPVSDEEGCFIWQGEDICRAERITVADPKGGEDTDERSEPALSEVCVKTSSRRVPLEAQESPGKSYFCWMLTVLSYIATFGLGILLSLYLLIPPERIILVPADPATGQPLDPRLRDPQRSVAPSAPNGVTPDAQTPPATLPPAHATDAQPRKGRKVENNNDRIRISLEDLVAEEEAPRAQTLVAPTSSRSYGTIQDGAPDFVAPEESGSVFLRGWFYLGVAGLVGALAGWGICEPGFVDGGRSWGNFVLIPTVVTLMCISFAVAESVVERSVKKALFRGLLSLPLGFILGFLFSLIANIFFNIGLAIISSMGVASDHNPAFWVSRGFAWMIFGAAGGIVYGIVGQSGKKTGYGVLGGVLGAGLGGMIFDPISFATHGGAASRGIGFALFGLFTGVAVGLVESALKDRWLYVTAGPLAGKQFILYKPRTVVGSDQQSDIYLFKDREILPQHVVLEMKGARIHLRASGPVYVNGQPVQAAVLDSGNIVQVGRYTFRYQEKQRS